ncbi:MAG: hypothetical protein RQ826_16965 [Xanthomonadales bacterium]|nr:hypothetical protein [Xanthomonadales bacterium]
MKRRPDVYLELALHARPFPGAACGLTRATRLETVRQAVREEIAPYRAREPADD